MNYFNYNLTILLNTFFFFFTEIVDSVKSKEKCLRPSVADLSCDEEVGVLMKRCWTEDPADRPDFTTLKAVIRKLNK